MIRTEIQLPEPLVKQIKCFSAQRGWSLAEFVRRGMEAYLQTCPEPGAAAHKGALPVLRGSGGTYATRLADGSKPMPSAPAVPTRGALYEPASAYTNRFIHAAFPDSPPHVRAIRRPQD